LRRSGKTEEGNCRVFIAAASGTDHFLCSLAKRPEPRKIVLQGNDLLNIVVDCWNNLKGAFFVVIFVLAGA
jgi:hypothetical protein